MTRTRSRRGRWILVFLLGFAAGGYSGWRLRGPELPDAIETEPVAHTPTPEAPPDQPPAISPEPPAPAMPSISSPSPADAITELRHRSLRVPIDNVDVEKWSGMFGDSRDKSRRKHEAVDIMAPMNTPIHAVENGSVAKLFDSKAGGITVYQFDPTKRFCYYYAHLARYADGLTEGQGVSSGMVIGYVGTSGNAAGGDPHLHFTIFELGADHHWWQGLPIYLYLVFHQTRP